MSVWALQLVANLSAARFICIGEDGGWVVRMEWGCKAINMPVLEKGGCGVGVFQSEGDEVGGAVLGARLGSPVRLFLAGSEAKAE
jgi:hypothetical protein